MNAGNSPSGWMRNRGTLMNAGNSPSGWMRNRGTLTGWFEKSRDGGAEGDRTPDLCNAIAGLEHAKEGNRLLSRIEMREQSGKHQRSAIPV